MKLDYFTLLSYQPLTIPGIGSVRSPTLNEIADIHFDLYHYYLSLMLMDIPAYYSTIDKLGANYFNGYSDTDQQTIAQIRNEYEAFEDAGKVTLTFYDVMIFDPGIREAVCAALNFFLVDTVSYDSQKHAFVTYSGITDDNDSPVITGYIYTNNFTTVADIILQRNGISQSDVIDATKVKSPKALRILDKIKKARRVSEDSNPKADKRKELANIISAVSSYSKSINIITIWDMTVYQVYDTFYRLQVLSSYDIQSMSVAAHGDEKKQFDICQWFDYRK